MDYLKYEKKIWVSNLWYETAFLRFLFCFFLGLWANLYWKILQFVNFNLRLCCVIRTPWESNSTSMKQSRCSLDKVAIIFMSAYLYNFFRAVSAGRHWWLGIKVKVTGLERDDSNYKRLSRFGALGRSSRKQVENLSENIEKESMKRMVH